MSRYGKTRALLSIDTHEVTAGDETLAVGVDHLLASEEQGLPSSCMDISVPHNTVYQEPSSDPNMDVDVHQSTADQELSEVAEPFPHADQGSQLPAGRRQSGHTMGVDIDIEASSRHEVSHVILVSGFKLGMSIHAVARILRSSFVSSGCGVSISGYLRDGTSFFIWSVQILVPAPLSTLLGINFQCMGTLCLFPSYQYYI